MTQSRKIIYATVLGGIVSLITKWDVLFGIGGRNFFRRAI